MIRSFNPQILNFYLNHSSIYPHITKDKDPEYLDCTTVFEEQDPYFFHLNGGCLLFLRKNDSFTLDGFFLPRKRGAYAKGAAKEGISYMFSEGAKKIIAEVPDCNRPSQMMIGILGFKRIETNKGVWIKNGIAYDLGIYEIVNDGQYS